MFADAPRMDIDPEQQWRRVEISETLVGRRAGTTAAAKALEYRQAHPLQTRIDRLLRRRTDERAWRKGANGERVTGWLLGRLPDGWHTFHDISVGDRGANIDHLVIGPGGVFTVNAKNLSGEIRVTPRSILHNGHVTDFLPKARAEARRASALLSAAATSTVAVRPVLAILVDVWTIRERPDDIFVGAPFQARRWILGQPSALGPHDVIGVAAAAAKPETWLRPPDPDRCACGGGWVRRQRRRDGAPFLGCSRFPACRRTRPVGT